MKQSVEKEFNANAAQSRKKARRGYQTHALSALKKALKRRGRRGLDGRLREAKEIAKWKRAVIADLGGEEHLSAAQMALIDSAGNTRLQLIMVDTWLAAQASIVNGRRKTAYPVEQTRIQLADSLLRTLTALGIERRNGHRVPSLDDALAAGRAAQGGPA